MGRSQRIIPIQLAARKADQMRGIQPCMLRVDRYKHLYDVIFRHSIENDRRDCEVLVANVLDIGVQREKPVLAIDGAKYSFTFRNFEAADSCTVLNGFERQLLVTRDDDSTGYGRQVVRLAALLVVLNQFVDLSPDDLALIGLLARRDATLEEIPVHL